MNENQTIGQHPDFGREAREFNLNEVPQRHTGNQSMKVEIDLSDILTDEYGPTESLAESIRRQVVEHLTSTIEKGVGKKIDEEVARIINEQIAAVIETKMPSIIEDLMSTEYRPVDRYGQRFEGMTTFRKELVKVINEQMVYRKANSESEKNAFTKAADAVISESVSKFKSDFNKMVDGEIVKEAMAYATKKLSERLGVNAA